MIRWSKLKAMQQSPLAYAHGLTVEREDTDTSRLGRLVHTLVLQPERVEMDYVVWMDGVRRGKAWDAFVAEHADKTIVKPEMMADAHSMAAAIMARDPWAVVGTPVRVEHELRWTDAATGLECGGRLDAGTGRAIVELKTTRSIDAEAFARDVYRFGYHCQLVHYRAGCVAMGLAAEATPCWIIAVEVAAPFDVAIFRVSEDALAYGAEEVDRLIRRVAECEKAGTWPGRYPEPIDITLPRWAMSTDESEIGDLGLHDSEDT